MDDTYHRCGYKGFYRLDVHFLNARKLPELKYPVALKLLRAVYLSYQI